MHKQGCCRAKKSLPKESAGKLGEQAHAAKRSAARDLQKITGSSNCELRVLAFQKARNGHSRDCLKDIMLPLAASLPVGLWYVKSSHVG